MKFTLTKNISNCKDAENIRKSVFINEQGFKIEFDDTDKTAYHVVCFDNDKAIGTARFFPEDNAYRIGRVAVLPCGRGKGTGSLIMQFCESEIKNLGGTKIVISAQKRALHFYESLGYIQDGKEYMDEHVPHVSMYKII